MTAERRQMPPEVRAALERVRGLNWSVIAPLVAAAVGIAAIVWFDATTGGEGEPPALLGEVGTPVRGTFVPVTRAPRPTATARPVRPTPEGVPGTPAERDAIRRADLLVLLSALDRYAADEDEFPSTGGNAQTLCVYRETDGGCALEEYVTGELPHDPVGDPILTGYWYSSNGQRAVVYASLEETVPESQICQENPSFAEDIPNLICVVSEQ
jgi:hypothetical protein